MSRGSVPEFQRQIAEKRFAPTYYLYGDEDYRKDAALHALIANAVDTSTRDFNLDQRRGMGLDPRSLGSLLATPPVLAAQRVIVLRDVGGLKKDARAVLEQYLRKPATDIVLVMTSAAGDKADANLQELATAIEFTPLTDAGAIAWMIEHAREVHGARLNQDAAELLLATVGSDLAALAAEIDKCASYAGERANIDTSAVEAVVGVRHGETLGDLLKAVAQRNAPDALRLVAPVLAQPKNGLIPVLTALGVQLMAIGIASAARNNGASAAAVRGRLWDMLKGGSGSYTGGPWGEAVERWAQAVRLWPEDSVQEGLRALLLADRSAKDSRLASDEQILSSVILKLCGDGRRAAA
jgi:DNA polymerase-3 subunit delta